MSCAVGYVSGNQSGEYTGRDPLTGEVKKQFYPDVPEGTYWFHHRCYQAKATEKYIMPSRTGIEYVDMEKQHWDLNHWVRGACLYGILPANGLLYSTPHACACYIKNVKRQMVRLNYSSTNGVNKIIRAIIVLVIKY